MASNSELPVVIIGAGPVGLAAAAQCAGYGISAVILERGPQVAQSLRAWGHVRVFSPWSLIIDRAARKLLGTTGWQGPDEDLLPTGAEIVTDYLEPLATHPAIAPHIRYGRAVMAVTRAADGPFILHHQGADGAEETLMARAVIDASGTWDYPNPMGIDGNLVLGEAALAGKIAYGLPDVAGMLRGQYVGKHTLVIGSGHSAMNVVLALLQVQKDAPQTRVSWGLRHDNFEKLLGGGLNDQLPARGELGLAAKRAIASGALRLLAPLEVYKVSAAPDDQLRLDVMLKGAATEILADRVVVSTGFRPDLSLLQDLHLSLDPVVEAPTLLAPMIDPRLHSCGTVPPHGVVELQHPETGFFIAGSKSYGRAPTFLMATGYEQVRSIVAELAGDHEAARQVQLVLPETGVCKGAQDVAGETASEGCCGGPAPLGVVACCVADAKAKEAGKAGCGCDSTPVAKTCCG
ncbi:MAG: NAD(P)-binding domain-containing protein [Pseudomonadota bacterium]